MLGGWSSELGIIACRFGGDSASMAAFCFMNEYCGMSDLVLSTDAAPIAMASETDRR
jgi:hypothetical protein